VVSSARERLITLAGARDEPLVRVAVGAGAHRHDPLSVVRDFHRLQARAYADECWLVPFDLYAFDRIWS
jgi:hypothetical protein